MVVRPHLDQGTLAPKSTELSSGSLSAMKAEIKVMDERLRWINEEILKLSGK